MEQETLVSVAKKRRANIATTAFITDNCVGVSIDSTWAVLSAVDAERLMLKLSLAVAKLRGVQQEN